MGWRSALAAAAVFIAFVVGAFLATRTTGSGSPRQSRISLFLVYCLAISAAVGFTGRPLYPFYHWPLLAGVLPDTVFWNTLVAVDTAGLEQEIDARAWEPMNVEDVTYWAFSPIGFFALDSAAQDRAARDLLRHLEAARQRARAGRRLGTYRRLLGPFAAPTFLMHRPLWTAPGPAPAARLVGLRWYLEGWRPLGPVRADNVVGRTLQHQVMPP